MFDRRILKDYNTNTDEWMNLSVDTIRPSDVLFVSPNPLGFAVACLSVFSKEFYFGNSSEIVDGFLIG